MQRLDITRYGISMAAIFLLCMAHIPLSLAGPGIESFGHLPTIRSMSISPDGKHIAFVREDADGNVLLVYDLKKRGSAPVGARLRDEVKSRGVFFVSNTQVVLKASDAVRLDGSRDKFEQSGSYVFSIEDKNVRVLLNKSRGLHPAQSGLGKIVGLDPDADYAYMPAFSNRTTPTRDLYRVSLETGLGEQYSRGRSGTLDWFVSRDGRVLAREDFDEIAMEHRIYSYPDGKPQLIYKNETKRPNISVQAVSDDENKILFVDQEKKDVGVFTMDLSNGEIGGPLFARNGSDIAYLLTDINRKLLAVVYSRKPAYSFQNAHIDKLYGRVSATFPDSSITYLGSTSDLSKTLFQVSGNYDPHSFVLFDAEQVSLNSLGSGYPDIKNEDIGEVVTISYEARDGLEIPALITWPAHTKSQASRRNLPLLVQPHGGPESHDSIGFHWRAQYFASKGYLILQPNFRGSSGFGKDFMHAGRGKWGKEMQDDVTDGVSYLVNQGYADPKRVCIMGASYGGYSALAGGAFTPDIYRCVVSVNGVSDLPRMLADTKQKHGRTHWVNSYWRDVIGDSKEERDKLKEVSPAYATAQFTAPLLLLHSRDDTVVPLRQSKVMYRAMKKSGQDVELVVLDGEDHWLSTSEMRLRTLKEIDRFLMMHNPPD